MLTITESETDESDIEENYYDEVVTSRQKVAIYIHIHIYIYIYIYIYT